MKKVLNPVTRPGKVKKYTVTPHGIIGISENAQLVVTLLTQQIVQVKFLRSSDHELSSYAVTASPQSVEFKVSEQKCHIKISNPAFNVLIDRSESTISFQTSNGKTINQDEKGLGTTWNGEQVTTYKKLMEGERFIGLGEKVGPLDRRGKGYVNWNTDAFAYHSGTDPIYATIPFYIGIHNGLQYGIFFDNSAKSYFNFGASNNRTSAFYADTGIMNYYFIYGKTVREIIQAYSWLTGTMPLPPIWSLGFQQCRYSYYPESEVRGIARNFRERNIPADAIVLDIHYMDAYKIFTWHPKHFPDPKNLIAELKEDGFHVVVMCDPGIKTEKGYKPFEEGKKQDLFLKYPDGEAYTGQVWPGWCHFPDFTKPKTREVWSKWMKSYADVGVEGYWNDMNEFSSWGQMMPENIVFDFEGQKATARQGRNVYGIQMAKSTFEAARKNLMGKRPFNLTRSGYAGIQRYAALWTGDNVSYDEHMMLGVRLVNSLGLSGVAFSGYDIGGFVGDASPRLFARWISIGAFSPFFRVHSMINSRDSEPWSYGEEVEIISRNYISLRYQLMPYIYSLFKEASVSGLPVQRSLAIDYPHREEVYSALFEHQYLFGPNFLVAPCESQKEIIKVFLPPGGWYAFNDGNYFDGDQVITVDSPVHKLPVFVKAGAVIPTQDIIMHTGEKSEVVHMHVYKGKEEGSFEWYMDDGKTYAFEKGECCTRLIRYDGLAGKLVIEPQLGEYRPAYRKMNFVFHGFSSKLTVALAGKKIKLKSGDHSFFHPMEKFDPLGDAPEVGSEKVHHFAVSYSAGRISLALKG